MSQEGFQCPKCQQFVIRHVNSGKIMNLSNGPGGYRGAEHDHRKPYVNWKEHHEKQKSRFCAKCGIEFYTTVFEFCPNCMGYSCRKCQKVRLPKLSDPGD